MGIIVESEALDTEDGPMPDDMPQEFQVDSMDDEEDSFPEANYDLQNEIIKFFSNNPGADPELFRQFATSIGVEPDELQKQMNILFTQLLKLYLNDAEELGYGSSLTDEEVPEDIRQLVAPQPQE